MDILHLFSKYRRTTFQHRKKEDLPNTKVNGDHLWCITNSFNSPKLNPYPLRESHNGQHIELIHHLQQVSSMNLGEPSPCMSYSTTNTTSTGLPSEGLLMHHIFRSNDPWKATCHKQKVYKAFSFSSLQVWTVQFCYRIKLSSFSAN